MDRYADEHRGEDSRGLHGEKAVVLNTAERGSRIRPWDGRMLGTDH